MTADPIHLLPAGVALRTAEAVSAPSSDVSATRAPAPSPAVRAALQPEIRSEQWIEPEPAPAPAGTAREGARDPGAGERNAPPVYYDYDTAPRAVRTLEPEYPLAARNAGLEGTVVINLNLDEQGRILRAWVASSSAPDILVSAALDAVYQFEFSPGLSRGVPVRSTVAIPLRFTLKRTT
jgi:TonB family protein